MSILNSFSMTRAPWLYGVTPGDSGGVPALNELVPLVDSALSPVVADVITSASAALTLDAEDYGRAWLWNVASGTYTGSNEELAALNSDQTFERGDLLIFGPGGFRRLEMDAQVGSLLAGDGMVLYCGDTTSLDTNDAYGTPSANNFQHFLNRRASTATGFILWPGATASDTAWGSAHGWIFLGGLGADQPWGWESYGAGLTDAGTTAAHDTLESTEIASGWYLGRIMRRLVWRLSSLPTLGNTTYLNLDPAGRNLTGITHLVNIRIILQDDDGEPMVCLPGYSPGQAITAWLDETNKRLYVRRNAENFGSDFAAVGLGSDTDLDDWDQVHIVLEYTGTA